VIFQQTLRNPLADPSLIGVSAGAGLALALALAFAPELLASGREPVALGGAALGMLASLGLAWRSNLSPVALVLAGIVVALYCGALSAAVQIVDSPYLRSFYLWGAGSLSQQDGSVALHLLPRLAGATFAACLVARPLALLDLGEEGARGLGLSPPAVRLAGLVVAVALSAFVVSAAGIIGFIGLACPTLARLAGARRFAARLIWAPLLGAALLSLADQIVQFPMLGGRGEIPTGAATALLGAPFLLWALGRDRGGHLSPAAPPLPSPRLARPWATIGLLFVGLALAALVSLHLGRAASGWEVKSVDGVAEVLRWRAPRMLGAMAAGAMLAMAGALLQRVTGNPMASPELLGISGSVALGMTLTTVFGQGGESLGRGAASAVAVAFALASTMLVGRRSGYAPDHVLVAGAAVGALASVLTTISLARGLGDLELRSWLMGASDLILPRQAVAAAILAVISVPAAWLIRRWLAIVPLGASAARGLGVDPGRSRLVMLLFAAFLTAAATATMGPLGFAGLMAPHLARTIGLARPMAHLAGAALLGATLMVAADWLGRTMLFPYEMPAGLVATLIGGPYLMAMLTRRRPA
jgi:ferric hydroxamate transport system permease protein